MSVYFTYVLTLFNFTAIHGGRVLLTLYALKLGAEPFVVGLLAATYTTLPLLLSWQAGRLSDRFGSRWTLMFGAAGGASGLLVPCLFPGLPALYVAGTLNGVLLGFCGVSLQNLVGLQSRPHNRVQYFSNFSLMISVGTFLGPLLAGFSIDHLGYAGTCLLVASLSVVPLTMLGVRGGALPRGVRSSAPRGSVREVLLGSGLWRVLLASSLMMTGFALFNFYMPVYGSSIGLSASAIGVVIAMYSAASFFVRLVLPGLIDRFTVGRVLGWAFWLSAVASLFVPFFESFFALALISFVFGLGMGCGHPITVMLTYSSTKEGRSGEVLGMRVTVNQLTGMVIPVIFGAIGSAFGVFPVFWINALMLASGGAFSKPGRIQFTEMNR